MAAAFLSPFRRATEARSGRHVIAVIAFWLGASASCISQPINENPLGDRSREQRSDDFGASASAFGKWSTDDAGLPCFGLNPESPADSSAPLDHLMSTGVMTALIDRWGGLKLMTCAGGNGQKRLRPSPFQCLSDLFLTIDSGGDSYSLFPSEWDQPRRARWGIGFARFDGAFTRGDLKLGLAQEIVAPWTDEPGVVGQFTVKNDGGETVEIVLQLRAQIAALPGNASETDQATPFEGGDGWVASKAVHSSLGQALLVGPGGWKAAREYFSLLLTKRVTLAPGEATSFAAWVGCTLDRPSPVPATLQARLAAFDPSSERQKWADRLRPVKLPVPARWMAEECQWTAAQTLAFAGFDGSRASRYFNLGGYGWDWIGVRESVETAIAVGSWMTGLAQESLLWMAKNQWPSGDIPKGYSFAGSIERTERPVESDNELWFLLAIGELVSEGLPESMLDSRVPFADGAEGTLWEHAKAAWRWIRDDVGVGPHGLVKMWYGDWNDYLSGIGRRGRGESTMNTGMACRALDRLAEIAERRGESDLARELQAWTAARREAMTLAFDRTHFVRGYTDAGDAIGGSAEQRVFLNAQTWAVLGRCGTPEMRRVALQTMLRECASPIGLMLMSRPYPFPAPATISLSPIPPGDGENAGIWPQTVFWAVWALAEEHMFAEAEQTWISMSLRNHATLHPDVPYGIWNGPDCYSSKFAGMREGRTQRQVFDRAALGIPMIPIVAWQSFAWRKIREAQQSSRAALPLRNRFQAQEAGAPNGYPRRIGGIDELRLRHFTCAAISKTMLQA